MSPLPLERPSPTSRDGRFSSQVHPLETSQHEVDLEPLPAFEPPREEFRLPPLDSRTARFLHSGWHRQRAATARALLAAGANSARMDRFANCGSHCLVLLNKVDQSLRLSANWCHDRMCQVCAGRRARRISAVLKAHCAGKRIRFLTLTLRHNRTPLTDQISRLYTCFTALRRRKAWKEAIVGGAAILEVKIGHDGLWHPHLHVLAEGRWFDKKELSTEWLAVTGDSHIIDIRLPRSDEELVSYVCKYVTKGCDSDVLRDPARAAEFIAAVRSRRLWTKFGTWHGLDLEADEEEEPGDWIVVGRLSELIADAERSVTFAQGILLALRQKVAKTPP